MTAKAITQKIAALPGLPGTEHTLVTYKGQSVRCYGKWRDDSNALVIWSTDTVEEASDFYCDGGRSWAAVVRKLVNSAWGQGKTIEELQAC